MIRSLIIAIFVASLLVEAIVTDISIYSSPVCEGLPIGSIRSLSVNCEPQCEIAGNGVFARRSCNGEEDPEPRQGYANIAFYKTASCLVWSWTVEAPLETCVNMEQLNVFSNQFPLSFKSAQVALTPNSAALQLRTYNDAQCSNNTIIYPQSLVIAHCMDNDKNSFPGLNALSYRVFVNNGSSYGINLGPYSLWIVLGSIAGLVLVGFVGGCIIIWRRKRLSKPATSSSHRLDDLADVHQYSDEEEF